MSRNIKDMRTARTPTLPIDPFQTYFEVHQDNLAPGLKSTGVSSNEILSSGPGTVTVTDNYEALVTDMIIYANMTNKSVTMNASKQIGSSVKIWKISDYDGDHVTVLPGSGITIEGLSELKLYGKYSFVELERISATVFAIKDLKDEYTVTETTIEFGGASVGVTYASRSVVVTIIKGRASLNGSVVLSNKGSSVGGATINVVGAPPARAGAITSVPQMRMASVTYVGQYTGYIGASSSVINLNQISEAGTITAISNSNFANNSSIIFSCEYPI